MKLKNACNLPLSADITDADGIIITQNGKLVRMTMDQFRAYVGFASGADVLGVPVPTSAEAGKVPAVNNAGTGYILKNAGAASVWKNTNPTAGFAEQDIAVPTDCKLFVFVMKKNRNNEEYYTCIVPNIPGIVHVVSGSPNGVDTYMRSVTITSTGIHVDGEGMAINITMSESAENYAIPYEIYGIA